MINEMYLFNRIEAGRMLADQLLSHKSEPNVVMALSPGGIIVGQEIARALECEITMLLTKEINLPGLDTTTFGVVDQSGGFTYNNMLSTGFLEEMESEFRNYIEQAKMEDMHDIHEAIGRSGTIDRHDLNGHNIILVSDGLKSGTSFDAAISYLKPVSTQKLIVAVPFVSIEAVDTLHVLADEMRILDVKVNYLDTDHYYEDNFMPDKAEIDSIIQSIDQKAK
jgi:predicted phosphoribosyltransferase